MQTSGELARDQVDLALPRSLAFQLIGNSELNL
jgi:hypothetical protein